VWNDPRPEDRPAVLRADLRPVRWDVYPPAAVTPLRWFMAGGTLDAAAIVQPL